MPCAQESECDAGGWLGPEEWLGVAAAGFQEQFEFVSSECLLLLFAYLLICQIRVCSTIFDISTQHGKTQPSSLAGGSLLVPITHVWHTQVHPCVAY